MLDRTIRQLVATEFNGNGAQLEALSGDVDRARLAVNCIHDMAVGLPDDVRAALDRIEALAVLAADKLQSISADLETLAAADQNAG